MSDKSRQAAVSRLLGVPATGRILDFHSLVIWRVQDGKLVERWGGLREAVRLYERLTQQETV